VATRAKRRSALATLARSAAAPGFALNARPPHDDRTLCPRWETTVMRSILTSACILTAALFSTSALVQGDYPNRMVKVVNPYVAGSTTDILARALSSGLSSRLGQQFVVENRAGAGGTLGTAAVARSDPDGYTLLFAPALVLTDTVEKGVALIGAL